MGKVNKELLKGASDIIIMQALQKQPLYGYEIARQIREQSGDVFSMGEGTLYPILHKLESQGLLESFWEEYDGRKRKYYALTRSGKKLLKERTEEWVALAAGMQTLLAS
jgi:PadR family transcriptional regulator PadR